MVGLLLLNVSEVVAQGDRDPHIGYVFPAGAQAGTTVQVTIGGQFLEDVTALRTSGAGIAAADLKFDRPLNNREVNIIQDKIDQAREKLDEQGKKVDVGGRSGAYPELLALLKEMDVTEDDLRKLQEYRQRDNDPKRQLNPQLEQTVTATLTVAADATPGRREVRLLTPKGLSNPLAFFVNTFPEYTEQEPNDIHAADPISGPLPAVLNGQIMPGDVDRFRFEASRGDKLVFLARARELMPYLADAVPGWFQAVLTVYDDAGRELAYADDYRFHPDPVLFLRIPQDGVYEVEIKDSIYRGREDFVYRVEVGDFPFLKTLYPLGARVGTSVTVSVDGWNLPVETLTLEYPPPEVGWFPVSVAGRKHPSNALPFDVDDYPEVMEMEPNQDLATAQSLQPPCIINGRMDQPGDTDVFQFGGRKGGQVMLEVLARRLGSPLDSLLKVTDANGSLLLANDDTVDKASGLVTHHADSQLLVTLPETGSYFIHLSDTQKKGGDAYGYRLRVSARRPDFDLRVVPSSINARPGSVVPLTVYAVRRDGFAEDIRIRLVEAPPGFELSGARVPADKESEDLTLTVPANISEGVYALKMAGSAVILGRETVRPMVPADDMMQAFIYRHLVPAEELLVAVSGEALVRRPPSAANSTASADLLRIPLGGTVRYQLPIPNRPNLDDVQVELSNPPDGITILRTARGPGGLVMLFSADAEMTKPGNRGNLLLNVFVERTVPGQGGRPGTKRKVPIGTFPAIPFEVGGR